MSSPNERISVVGLGGSLARKSASLAALRIALEGAQAAGAEVHIYDIRAMDLPFYTPDAEEIPAAAAEFCETVFAAQGMIWSSPLYHGTVSGAFKNALDWLNLLARREPPYLTDKIIGMVSTAGGVHGLQAINTMEFSVRSLRAWAVPMVMPIPRAWEAFDERGGVTDPRIAEQLHALGTEVVRAARQFSAMGYCDYSMPISELAG